MLRESMGECVFGVIYGLFCTLGTVIESWEGVCTKKSVFIKCLGYEIGVHHLVRGISVFGEELETFCVANISHEMWYGLLG
jgi:hypothetical protein